jgi:hypothetical protein
MTFYPLSEALSVVLVLRALYTLIHAQGLTTLPGDALAGACDLATIAPSVSKTKNTTELEHLVFFVPSTSFLFLFPRSSDREVKKEYEGVFHALIFMLYEGCFFDVLRGPEFLQPFRGLRSLLPFQILVKGLLRLCMGGFRPSR